MNKNKLYYAGVLLVVAGIMKYGLANFLSTEYNTWLVMGEIILIMIIGVGYVLKGTAQIIEETAEVLSEKTKLATGMLQSLGTAFPDMVLGITAAIISLRVAGTDYTKAINFAIIAAATTFGSNIYNIGYAIWCINRQNLANGINKTIRIIPFLKNAGMVTPINQHKTKPALKEFDTANDILNTLGILTAIVAMSMVLFGKVSVRPENITGDLYQLIKPIGWMIFVLAIFLMYKFRKTQRVKSPVEEIIKDEKFFRHQKIWVTWLSLLMAGGAILMAAESMVRAIEVFSIITKIPSVVSGVAAGLIGCLGEIIATHKHTVNPTGRIGDAVVGVAMDNIVTIIGASIVAIMGGIFLGGNALILIFVLILTLNSTLIWQISRLKNYFLKA